VAELRQRTPQIFVLAGCNGAGKSSIGGEAFRAAGTECFDPDVAARRILQANAARGAVISQTEANGEAWEQGVRLLRRAIAERRDYAFETTLGGDTIARLLAEAAAAGHEIRVWFVGLASVELHVDRVRRRVAKGGHDIPVAAIRHRFVRGRINLIRLLPRLTELRVYDNSVDADPDAGATPEVSLVLHWKQGRIAGPSDLRQTPGWAKPIVAAARKSAAG
jgi:predicted ABC-type ATPase